MKKTWIEQFDSIDHILRTSDPMGLIESGAPQDEYEIEALEVFLMIKRNLIDSTNVFDQVSKIFRNSFGEIPSDTKIRLVSDLIKQIPMPTQLNVV